MTVIPALLLVFVGATAVAVSTFLRKREDVPDRAASVLLTLGIVAIAASIAVSGVVIGRSL